MTTPHLLAFLDRLQRSRLLDATRLQQMHQLLLPGCTRAEELARALIGRGWLTAPQARALLAGRSVVAGPRPTAGHERWLLAGALLGLAVVLVGLGLLVRHLSAAPDEPATEQAVVDTHGDNGTPSADSARLRPLQNNVSTLAPLGSSKLTAAPPSKPADPPAPEKPAPQPPVTAKPPPPPLPPEDKADEDPTDGVLVNGSFEEGPPVDDFVSLDMGSTALPGWTVIRGQIDYIGTFYAAGDGSYSLDLNGSPGFGGVEQTIKTTKGRRYRVTFLLAGNPGGQEAVKHLMVSAAGQKQEFDFDTTGYDASNVGWVEQTWEFEAVGPTTKLAFYSADTVDAYSGPALDNVRLERLPRTENQSPP